MGAVRKSTREGEEVFSREVGYGAQEAGGGLEFVCEVQSRGCSWCNVTGRTRAGRWGHLCCDGSDINNLA